MYMGNKLDKIMNKIMNIIPNINQSHNPMFNKGSTNLVLSTYRN